MIKQTINISGPWEFREFPQTARRMSDLEDGRWLPTTQQQSVFRSLAEAGILTMADLYAQPEAFGWVSRQPWVYRTKFDLSQEQFDANQAELVFDGLDTVTQIWLNDKLIGRTENMFISHHFDVRQWIRPGRNELTIQFQPALDHAEKIARRYGKTSENSTVHVWSFLRKAPFHFGSIMGPALPDCGIIGPVRLELTPMAAIQDVHLRTIDCNENFADIRAAVKIRRTERFRGKNLQCLLKIHGEGMKFSHSLKFDPQQDILSTVLHIEKPVLWRPRGYGLPCRCNVQIEIYDGNELLDVRELLFGIRTARVVHSFSSPANVSVEINHCPVEIKGIYWIPMDLLHALNNQANKESLLHDIADANINLLYLQGDGYYENDSFYDLCDRLGILVWQDFVTLPDNLANPTWFDEQFQQEAKQVVCRLRNYACLIGWSGKSHTSLSATDRPGKKSSVYEILHHTLPDMLSEWDPDRDYVPQLSALDWQKIKDFSNKTANLPNLSNSTLFVNSEVFPALPCLETLRITCREETLFVSSRQVEKQNHFEGEWAQTVQHMNELFAPPRTIEEQIYQSQVTQARIAKKDIESLRVQKDLHSIIIPWTAGQFWPGTGCSMVDFADRPNALYFYMKRCFAPVTICLTGKKRSSADALPSRPDSAVVINDRPEPLTGEVIFELLNMQGQTLDAGRLPITVGPYSKSTAILLSQAFSRPTFPDKNILRLAISAAGPMLYENLYLYVPDKYAAFRPLEIDLEIHSVSNKKLQIHLTSRYFVKDMEIVPPQETRLSNNFFDLLPGRKYEVTADFNEPFARINTPFILRSVCGMQ